MPSQVHCCCVAELRRAVPSRCAGLGGSEHPGSFPPELAGQRVVPRRRGTAPGLAIRVELTGRQAVDGRGREPDESVRALVGRAEEELDWVTRREEREPAVPAEP